MESEVSRLRTLLFTQPCHCEGGLCPEAISYKLTSCLIGDCFTRWGTLVRNDIGDFGLR
jgi:hypothetical protein